VVEKESRPGGVIQTVSENGFTYELGPNTGVIGSSEIAELFEELNGLCELETANENAQKRYILKNGKWEQLPSGVMAGIKTPLFTWKDKFRLLGEPFRGKGKDPHETLSALVKRRMGQSFLDYAVDPFIIGVYAGDPEILVPKYALPKLYNLEQDYGSFIGGAVKKQFQKKTEAEKKITRKVFSARGGLSNLVNALYENAGKENFSFHAGNLQVVPEKEGYKVSWQAMGKSGKSLPNMLFLRAALLS
jgi:protoporphyrinogen/coproporphyrinogen III oxidase